MGFQVNGTTIIDNSRNFATSAFPKTVNGQAIHGSGELKYIRPGVSSNHVVGDYIIAGHTDVEHMAAAGYTGSNIYTKSSFAAGAILTGSGLCVRNNSGYGVPFGQGMPFPRYQYDWTAVMTSNAETTLVNGFGQTITNNRQKYGFTISGSWKVAVAGQYYSAGANDSYRTHMLLARVS